MAIPDPTKSAPSNYEASTCVNTHIIAALKGTEPFSALIHVATIKEVRTELTGRKKAIDGSALKAVLSKKPCDLNRAVARGKKTGQWLSVMPSTVNGTFLLDEEFKGAIHLRYGRAPGDLLSHCDGCGQKLGVQHTLDLTS
jgi:hypothetical protein